MNSKTIVLRDFQLLAVKKMCDNEDTHGLGSVLAFDMGLGKTLTFSSFLLTKREKERQTIPDLIIAPLCVLDQWKKEMLRLNERLNIFIYHGPNRARDLNLVIESVDFVVSTYHSLVTRELEKYKWNRVVLDEAHIIRNGIESKHRELPKKVIGAFAMKTRSRFRYCITGTPYNNNTNDVLSLMKFIGCESVSVSDFIRDFVLQKTKEDIMDGINIETQFVDKPKDGLEDYGKLMKQYAMIMAKLRAGNLNRIVAIALYQQGMKVMAKLRIYCDIMQMNTKKQVDVEEEENDEEYDYYDEIEYTVEEKADFYNTSSKIKSICDKLDEMLPVVPYKRIIIFSSFTTTLSILESVIKSKNSDVLTFQYTGRKKRHERDEIVKQFTDVDDTRPMVLLASLGAGSCGLNLVPCSTVFLADISMNPFDELQAINRVHRLTQTNKVNVIKFCMSEMIEESILMSHFRKIEDARNNGLLIV